MSAALAAPRIVRPAFWPSVLWAAMSGIGLWLWQHSGLLPLLGWRLPLVALFTGAGVVLIWLRRHGAGRGAALALLVLAQLLLLLLPLLTLMLLGQSLLLSLLRAGLFQRRWWPRLQDLSLSLLALMLAWGVLLLSRSPALALWSLLLMHAVIGVLPSASDGLKALTGPGAMQSTAQPAYTPSQAELQQRFHQAHQRACQAWQRCQQTPLQQ